MATAATVTGQRVFAAAADADLSARIASESDWYGTYDRYARELEEAQLRHPDTTVAVANAGLTAVHGVMEFVRDGVATTPYVPGSILSLAAARGLIRPRRFAISGSGRTGSEWSP